MIIIILSRCFSAAAAQGSAKFQFTLPVSTFLSKVLGSKHNAIHLPDLAKVFPVWSSFGSRGHRLGSAAHTGSCVLVQDAIVHFGVVSGVGVRSFTARCRHGDRESDILQFSKGGPTNPEAKNPTGTWLTTGYRSNPGWYFDSQIAVPINTLAVCTWMPRSQPSREASWPVRHLFTAWKNELSLQTQERPPPSCSALQDVVRAHFFDTICHCLVFIFLILLSYNVMTMMMMMMNHVIACVSFYTIAIAFCWVCIFVWFH